MALPRGAMGLSAVCNCGISWSYSLFLTRCNKSFIVLSEMIAKVEKAHHIFTKCLSFSVPSEVITKLEKIHRCAAKAPSSLQR